ncbi:MAG: hypothetical protein ABI894_15260 [Ilumatobacteraceae bacterium]
MTTPGAAALEVDVDVELEVEVDVDVEDVDVVELDGRVVVVGDAVVSMVFVSVAIDVACASVTAVAEEFLSGSDEHAGTSNAETRTAHHRRVMCVRLLSSA